jgi:hypothetical protein
MMFPVYLSISHKQTTWDFISALAIIKQYIIIDLITLSLALFQLYDEKKGKHWWSTILPIQEIKPNYLFSP